MLMLAATGMLQRFGDVIVVAVVLALAAYGVQFGLFLAVVAGMHVLASLVVALAFAQPLAGLLTGMEVPTAYAFPAAFGGLLVGTAVAIRLAVGGYVPADVVRFTPAIDKAGGGLVGALAGFILAGTALIALSIIPLPVALRIDGSRLRFDAGTKVLNTFVRCVAADEDDRKLVAMGEQPQAPPAAGPSCSEVFSDVNGNDAFDDGERYLDADANGSFTIQLPYSDGNGNGRRDVGLIERYRLGGWLNAKVLNAPTIDSAETADVRADVKDGDVVYQIVAIDMDPNDTFTYGMRIDPNQPTGAPQKPGEKEQGGTSVDHDVDVLSVDKTTGAVKMTDAQAFRDRKSGKLRILVSVTDMHGLKAERAVTLNRKAAKPEAAKP